MRIKIANSENKKQLIVSLAITIVLLLSIQGCEKSPMGCFTSTGSITKIDRTIDAFHSIVLKDNVNLYLRQAGENKITVEAGNNLMSKIYTEVNGAGYLEIGNDNKCNWVRSYKKPINVYLDFIRLDSLEYRSIGNVTNDDTIRMDTLVVNVWEGAGTIDLTLKSYKTDSNLHYGTAEIITSGITTVSNVYLAGAGKIDNKSLAATHVYLNNKSSNDIYISSSKTIGATIENIGNIYYFGNPGSVSLDKIGSGNLIKLE